MRIIRLEELMSKTGLSRTSVWRYEKADNGFPRRRRLGPNAVGWDEAEVDKWLAEREIVGAGTGGVDYGDDRRH